MNLQQIASKHSVKLSQLKTIADSRNWDINNISEAQEKQLIEAIKKPGFDQKQLSQSQNLPTTQNSGKDLTNASQDLNPYSKERSTDRIKKLISSAQLAGQSEAELYNAVKNDAFLNHAQNNDDDIFNEFINGAIAHSIQLKHAASHAGNINGIASTEEINIEAIEVEKTDWRVLQTSEQDIINRGFQKLLSAGE